MLSIENVAELNQSTETTKWVIYSFVVEQAAITVQLLKDK